MLAIASFYAGVSITPYHFFPYLDRNLPSCVPLVLIVEEAYLLMYHGNT